MLQVHYTVFVKIKVTTQLTPQEITNNYCGQFLFFLNEWLIYI
jgi:hypothetical protein